VEFVEDTQATAANDADDGIDVLCLQLLQQFARQVHFFHHLVGVHAADVERNRRAGLAEDARAVRVEVGDEPGSSATSRRPGSAPGAGSRRTRPGCRRPPSPGCPRPRPCP